MYVAAALRPGGHADLWLDIATTPSSGFGVFVSAAILDEVRDKLVNKFGIHPDDVQRLIERIQTIATVVTPNETLSVVDDPDDNAILECALAAQAHLVVTADHALLKLNPFRGIGIAHPRELRSIFASDFRKVGEDSGS
ncbi:putative toxin-antitoxin system toxin component, PIN family [Allorhizocola rhizosphaerae]|uniref:putative toxin-antitoxin system toxin component, PIN family n=1 Tax=Allorhizocola rhizosphaerae TaxID=1872709 RepID=UPI0013C2AE31